MAAQTLDLLDDVRVIDASRVLAGPFCGQLLGDRAGGEGALLLLGRSLEVAQPALLGLEALARIGDPAAVPPLLRRADGRGRVAALEILVNTSAVGHLVREGKTFQIPSVIQTGRNAAPRRATIMPRVAAKSTIFSLVMTRPLTRPSRVPTASTVSRM